MSSFFTGREAIGSLGEPIKRIVNHQVVQVASGRYRPGASQEELIYASELCQLEGGGSICTPEHFAEELSNWQAVNVKSFAIDSHEVSVKRFRACLNRGACQYALPISESAEKPMTRISFNEARKFCRAEGGDLPTELQFEFAATSGGLRRYPWGSFPHADRANWGRRALGEYNIQDGYRSAAPALSETFDLTPNGIFHLSGNVSEWTIASPSWSRDKDAITTAVIRGGHFRAPGSEGRNYHRRPAIMSRREVYLGFRCAH